MFVVVVVVVMATVDRGLSQEVDCKLNGVVVDGVENTKLGILHKINVMQAYIHFSLHVEKTAVTRASLLYQKSDLKCFHLH